MPLPQPTRNPGRLLTSSVATGSSADGTAHVTNGTIIIPAGASMIWTGLLTGVDAGEITAAIADFDKTGLEILYGTFSNNGNPTLVNNPGLEVARAQTLAITSNAPGAEITAGTIYQTVLALSS